MEQTPNINKKYPLWVYVTAVIVVLIIVNLLAGSLGGGMRARDMAMVSFGFLLGMFATYTAMHVYKHK